MNDLIQKINELKVLETDIMQLRENADTIAVEKIQKLFAERYRDLESISFGRAWSLNLENSDHGVELPVIPENDEGKIQLLCDYMKNLKFSSLHTFLDNKDAFLSYFYNLLNENKLLDSKDYIGMIVSQFESVLKNNVGMSLQEAISKETNPNIREVVREMQNILFRKS